MFYATAPSVAAGIGEDSSEAGFPDCRLLGQLGGRSVGLGGRIKDFEILEVPSGDPQPGDREFITVTGSSDGAVRLWRIKAYEILQSFKANGSSASEKQRSTTRTGSNDTDMAKPNSPSPRQIGTLVGTYETGNRITCLKAFVMVDRIDASGDWENGSEHPEQETDCAKNNSDSGGDNS
jgi:protein MAK11